MNKQDEKDFGWINSKDEKQMLWLLNYLEKYGAIRKRKPGANDYRLELKTEYTQKKTLDAFIEAIKKFKETNPDVIQNLKDAWRKKRSRENSKQKTINISISKESANALRNTVARYFKVPQNIALEKLIEDFVYCKNSIKDDYNSKIKELRERLSNSAANKKVAKLNEKIEQQELELQKKNKALIELENKLSELELKLNDINTDSSEPELPDSVITENNKKIIY